MFFLSESQYLWMTVEFTEEPKAFIKNEFD